MGLGHSRQSNPSTRLKPPQYLTPRQRSDLSTSTQVRARQRPWMNSPYGSFATSSDWSWYDIGEPGWESTPSTDGDYSFNNDDFTSYPGDFAPLPDTTTWHPAPGMVLAAPHNQQYDFNQGQQVWSVLDTHLSGPSPTAPTTHTSAAELMYIPHHGAIGLGAPPSSHSSAGLGITADGGPCSYPRATADHHPVTPEELQVLFPSPPLPRKEPPCLCDANGQPLQKQNPRFEGDLYAALWIRGEGVSRAGWCGFCGTWHRLKDSAYW